MTQEPNDVRLREVRDAFCRKDGDDRDDAIFGILSDATGDGLDMAAELTRFSDPIHLASCDCPACLLRLELIEQFRKAARRVRL